MKRARGAYKFLGMVFALSLLVPGICAAETNNETTTGLDSTQTFEWVLLLPIFLGSLLFLSWMCRFFDGMSSCFVLFIISVTFGALFFWSGLLESILGDNNYSYAALILLLTGTITFLRVVFILVLGESQAKKRSLSVVRSFMIILAVLTWPLILLYLYERGVKLITFYGMDELKFPVYIIAASSIGILSYLLLSIEETFDQLIPDYERLRIAWSYLKRILTAPFIAIIGFYLLNSLQNIHDTSEINDYFVFAFAFFAGVFTKTIEEWIYSSVQKLLPADRKSEFPNRSSYEVKESEFVKELHFDEDIAYMLYNAKIRKIDELADCSPDKLMIKLNTDIRNIGEVECYLSDESCNQKNDPDKTQKSRHNIGKNIQDKPDKYSLKQIETYINSAKKHRCIEKSELVTDLKMDRNIALMLYFANITSIEQLSKLDPNCIKDILFICNEQAEDSAQDENYEYMWAREVLCKHYKEEIIKSIGIAKDKIKEKTESVQSREK